MFKRVHFDHANVLAIAAFILSLAVFIFFLVRVIRMKRKDVQHLSQLPLDDDNSTNSPKP